MAALKFSDDDLVLLTTALEFFVSESRSALRQIPDDPELVVNRGRLERQIAQADALRVRIDDARR